MTVKEAVKTIDIDVIDYEKILARDAKEIASLHQALSSLGCFFLNLSGPSAQVALADMVPIVEAQRQFFARDIEHKNQLATDLPGRGYDNFCDATVQRLKLSREDYLKGILKLSPDLDAVKHKLGSVMDFNDAVLRNLCTLVCHVSNPPLSTQSIANSQDVGLSNMTLGHSCAPTGDEVMPDHLDEDMLTITYYDEPFLEILDPADNEWKNLPTKDNMPFVNVGDRLEALSEGRLPAPHHRVKQTPSEINLIMYDLDKGLN